MLTKSTLDNPTNILMVIILLLLAGIYSLTQLPVQLFPEIERPVINVQTGWRAASPREMESEVIEPIEKVLRGLPGMQQMSSFANAGFAEIRMEFDLNADMNQAYLEVISRMNRLEPLPQDVNQPTISLGGRGNDGPALIYFFLQLLPDNDNQVADYLSFVKNRISPVLESIPGVSSASAQGGAAQDNQLQIIVDPFLVAQYGLQMTAITNAVRGFNNISAGSLEVGRRKYTLRYEGRYSPEDLQYLIIEWREGNPIRLNDVAEIKIQQPDNAFFSIQNNNPAISIRVNKENDANTLKTLLQVKREVERLNRELLADKNIMLQQSFDASVFINRAINLVAGNLFLGVALSLSILWYFLRNFRATLAIAVSVPVSLFVSFIILKLTGRSLNIISLAGLAFAVGMVLDAAIVVLENIFRLRENKEESYTASLKGATQVWGALFASTLTTVAIFLPVLFLKEVEGQLFADLAITISIAVMVSLIVAMTIVPLFARQWVNTSSSQPNQKPAYQRFIVTHVMRLTRDKQQRRLLAGAMLIFPLLTGWILFPQMDYLPPVKRDAVDTFLRMPPGSSKAFIKEQYIDSIVERMSPYMSGEKQPALKNYYILTWPSGGTIGTRAKDQSQVDELLKVVSSEITADLPDLQAFSRQGNLFGGFGGGRAINLLIQHPNQEIMEQAATFANEKLQTLMPASNVRVNPGLNQNEPELQFIPNDRAINEMGLRRQDVGTLIRMLGDGIYLGEYFDGEKRLDIIVQSKDSQTPEAFNELPIVTPQQAIVPLNQLVESKRTVGPSRIQRVDQRRTIVLDIVPPPQVSLQKAIELIETELEPQIREILGTEGNISFSGSASDLNRAIVNIGRNFLFALVILFFLMSALFKSAYDSFLVILAMPMAMVGGILGLNALNLITFQPLDLLTMIGFVILLGLVVNNAILLVYKSRELEKEGYARDSAIENALSVRLRPILMSTLTSILGMLPLLLVPGIGAVIYRGLASVIVSGMLISMLFTLLLLPCLLRMGKTT